MKKEKETILINNKVAVDRTKDNVLKWIFFSTFFFAIIGYILMWVGSKLYGYDGFYYAIGSDFAEALAYAKVSNPYDGSSGITAIYPPITFLIFYPFLLICKKDITLLINHKIDLQYIYRRPVFLTTYILYFVITITLILLVAARMSKLKGKNLFYLLGTIFFCGSVYNAFNRGNVILTTVLFTLIFFWLYKSEKRWQREVSLFFLALAISTKIFPVLLVLILVKEHRWKDIVKTALYTIALVFVPFLFVSGNFFKNIKCIFNNYGNLTQAVNKFNCATTSFDGVALAISLNKHLNHGVIIVIKTMLKIFKYLFFGTGILALLLSYKNKRIVEPIAIVVACYITFQNASYAYVQTFMIIPFILFIKYINDYSKKDVIIYSILYGILFFPISFMFRNSILQFIAILIISIKSMVTLFKDLKLKKQETKNDNEKEPELKKKKQF